MRMIVSRNTNSYGIKLLDRFSVSFDGDDVGAETLLTFSHEYFLYAVFHKFL